MQKFFLYARKSTDVEDKQVLSIEAQITELRAYAKQENLDVVEELIEKQSAKIPGRPIFGKMLERIEHGEANGILAWHPDRLARNSVDGGRVIYLLDCGHLAILKFPTFWSDNTSQGKFMLNIAFELYAKNGSRLEDTANFLAQSGIHSKNGKRLHRDRISFILSNPFYYGHFRYAGEIYEGKHQPVITKKIFDKAQEVLKERGRPHHKPKNEPKAFCSLLSCAECGMGITAEVQKGHVYYRCTKKRGNCSQPYVREEKLDRQLSAMLQKFSLPEDWAEGLREMMKKDETKAAQSSGAFVQEAREKIRAIQT